MKFKQYWYLLGGTKLFYEKGCKNAIYINFVLGVSVRPLKFGIPDPILNHPQDVLGFDALRYDWAFCMPMGTQTGCEK